MTAPVSIDQSEASIDQSEAEYIDHSGDGLVGGTGGWPAVHCKHHRHGAFLCRDEETCEDKKKVSNKRKEEEEEKQDVEILTIMS